MTYNGLKFEASIMQVKEASGEKITTPPAVAEMFKDLATAAQEAFCVVTLNVRNRMIDKHLVTLGVLDASLVRPREVFRRALADGAAAVILVHNHPSGDPSPSAEDLIITRQLVEAGKIIDIRVLDHVIIGQPEDGRPGWISLRENGLVDFR